MQNRLPGSNDPMSDPLTSRNVTQNRKKFGYSHSKSLPLCPLLSLRSRFSVLGAKIFCTLKKKEIFPKNILLI
jgi:hypothetical protein